MTPLQPKRSLAGVMIAIVALTALAGCSQRSSPSPAPSGPEPTSAPSALAPESPGASLLPVGSSTDEPAASASATRSPSPPASLAPPVGSSPSSQPSQFASLPVVACTVTDGAIAGPPPTPAIRTLELRIPAALASSLVVYGVETNQLILGPRGWRCTGLVDSNTSSRVTIMDPADARAGIVVEWAPGAPYSGVLDLACPLFPEADRLLHATFGFDCPKSHVEPEQVTFVTREIARFLDPSGVKSVGALSGGPYAVEGALIYHSTPDNLVVAFQISCAMTTTDAAACGPVVDHWLARISAAYNLAP
jgi:hypothetical protein